MDTKDTALLTKLRGLFAGEAEERLQVITSSLLMLERQPGAAETAELVETLFREVHTLKGAARAVSLGEIEAISQAVETVCAGVKRKMVTVWPEFFDTLYRAMDVVRQLSLGTEPVTGQQVADVLEAVSQLEGQGRARAAAPVVTVAPPTDIEPPAQRMKPEPLSGSVGDANDSLLTKLRGLFAGEAEERLQVITSSLLMLERQPGAAETAELVETLFREVHTLKGAARAVSLGEIEAISQAVETVCAGVKRKTVAVWPEFFDTLYRAMDVVRQLSLGTEPVTGQQVAEVLEAVSQLEVQGRARAAAQMSLEQSEPQRISETILHDKQENSQSDMAAVHESVLIGEHQALSREETSPPRKEVKRSPRSSTTPRQRKEKPSRTPKKEIAASKQLRVALDEPERVELQTTSPQIEQRAEVMLTEQSLEPHPGFAETPQGSEKAPPTPLLPVAEVQLNTHIIPRAKAVKSQKSKSAAAPRETVRVEAAKLDALFLQAEEMLAVKLKTGEHAAELRGLVAMMETWKREWAKVHLNVRKAQSLLEKEEHRTSAEPIYGQAALLVEFLNWTQEHFRVLDKALAQLTKGVAKDQQALGSMVDILLEDAKKVLLLPFASTLEVLPRMVRDLSRAQGKEVEFTLRGEEVEIDKRILEAIKDPLIHLLRNCIDHGLERPAEREQLQKAPRGALSVVIAPSEGNTVEITVADDGAGINVAKVKEAAVACSALSQEAAQSLSDKEAIGLIFQSEVSTSATVSDISGRGLGMAIVREKIEKLGGQIAVETQPGRGTTFQICLPLTLATFRGILVQAGGQLFVAPTANVERVVRVQRSAAVHTEGNKEILSLAGYSLPLVQLDRLLGLPAKVRHNDKRRFQLALVVGQDDRHVAFGVDAVMNEQEVLFKGLGQQLVRVQNIAGVTVLGSGQVAPVLNVNDLLGMANSDAVTTVRTVEEMPQAEVQKKTILVAEDSITSRMLLKEILESAGYVVATAIDGEDAFSSLQKTPFDLVVSDVEMPRMNGFALTDKIRSDERYTQLPVVLVTGLESQGDRERGVTVGASAYVVKGSFDQSNLLETIRRLI